MTHRLLSAAPRPSALFAAGDYQPVEVVGDRSADICAPSPAVTTATSWLLVAVPRLVHQLHQRAASAADWGSTEIVLPREARWRDVLTGRTLDGRERVFAGVLFADFPVSVLVAEIDD